MASKPIPLRGPPSIHRCCWWEDFHGKGRDQAREGGRICTRRASDLHAHFFHPKNVGGFVEILKLPICTFLPSAFFFSPTPPDQDYNRLLFKIRQGGSRGIQKLGPKNFSAKKKGSKNILPPFGAPKEAGGYPPFLDLGGGVSEPHPRGVADFEKKPDYDAPVLWTEGRARHWW